MSVGPIYVCERTNRNRNVMSLYHLYSPANSVANFLHFGSRVHPEINTIFRQVYFHFPHKTKWNKEIFRNSTSCALWISVSMSHVHMCVSTCISREDNLLSASACHAFCHGKPCLCTSSCACQMVNIPVMSLALC